MSVKLSALGGTCLLRTRTLVVATGFRARRVPGIPCDGRTILDGFQVAGLDRRPAR